MIWEHRKECQSNGIQLRNIHQESTLIDLFADLFADNDLHDDNSCASDDDWGLNKTPKEDLKKITFDNHVDDNDANDLNIDNKVILHLNDGGGLICNIGVQHKQEDQLDHFGGPIIDRYQPSQHL